MNWISIILNWKISFVILVFYDTSYVMERVTFVTQSATGP